METSIITSNGNLINYKSKNGCNAQLLFHYICTINVFLPQLGRAGLPWGIRQF